MRWPFYRTFVPKLYPNDLQILLSSIHPFIPSLTIFFLLSFLPTPRTVFMKLILLIFFKSIHYSVITISLLPCNKRDYSPQVYSMVQIWTVLAMDGISPCSPWFFSTSDDPVSFFSTLSTVEGHQLLLHEAKCLAGALLHLDSLCTRPGVVLFCDLQGIIINSYMSQTVQVVLLRMDVGSIACRLY